MAIEIQPVHPDLRWFDDRCIICPERGKLTKEHIIRQSLGGRLWMKFLCAKCNNERFQPEEQRDRAWALECRLAVEHLRVRSPLPEDPLPDWPRLNLAEVAAAEVPSRLILLMAYEFAACVAGQRIYESSWDPVRARLMDSTQRSFLEVERWITRKYQWTHGLWVRETVPRVTVEVRLFRFMKYLVRFDVSDSRFALRAYTSDLATGREDFGDCVETPPTPDSSE